MLWNTFNGTILFASGIIVLSACFKLFWFKRNKTAKYLYWFIITANLVIFQLMLIDTQFTRLYPFILLFFVPFQFLSPYFFSAFTCSYLDKMSVFKKYRKVLLLPFLFFFCLYTFLKVNIILGYLWVTEQNAAQIAAEFDENIALAFALFLGIWNYKIIRKYESDLGNLPYQIVIKKTQWLKRIYATLVVLCLLWLGIILYIKVNPSAGGHGPYYPLWSLFIGFYATFCFVSSRHLKHVEAAKKGERASLRSVISNFQLEGLNRIFTSDELDGIQASPYEATSILGYFATSLFDKNREDEVLWEITKNCISRLSLEDSVIYLLNEDQNILVQKAAFGNKNTGGRKILSPLEIPIGKGIVGNVAESGQWLMVNDLSQDSRYILDDEKRCSELAVPIISGERILGVLDSENSEKDFFNEKHLFLFQLIAKLTATKLQQLSKKTSLSLTNDNAYYKELCDLLDNEKIYQDPELSLSAVAKMLNISSTYLSQLVNKLSNYNFSDFINLYRVREAEIKLVNPDFSRYTILSIGLEAGFNSKSAFYSAFKKHTGVTPTQFRDRRLVLS